MIVDVSQLGIVHTFILLIIAHVFGDYVFQSEFMALGKNPSKPLPNTPYWWPLTAHSIVHASLVLMILGDLRAALLELISHWIIDYSKCTGKFNGYTVSAFTIDQSLHIFIMFILTIMF